MTTRRALLASAAAAAASLAGPAGARADPVDRPLLELLVAYSGGVLVAYDLALREARLDRRERRMLRALEGEVGEMDDALRHALVRKGGVPPPRRPVVPVAAAGRGEYLKYIVHNEELLASGWYAALEKLTERSLVAGAAAYMAAAGRRLVVVRRMAGLPLLPRAFETGAS